MRGPGPATVRLLAIAGVLWGLLAAFSPDASSQAKKPTAAAPAKKPAAKAAAGGAADAGAPDMRATQASEIWTGSTGGDAGVVAPIYVPPPPRKVAPPPPPPTPEQIKGLEQLQTEAIEYEKSAKDYRDATTRIVQYHYEDKRRRMLASLDGEIAIEKKALGVAREEAIKRLEEFVARYSGKNAHPENTPDAMFRLAALYEERVRSDSPDDLSVGLRQAIDLYKRVIVEFPNYRELAGIFYYLGHALSDSNRIEESQQVWRSLVCHNKFPYPVPPDPKDPSKDTIVRLPQDHDDDFWRGWENAHPTPVGFSGKAVPKTGKGGKAVIPHGGENQYVNPYPQECAMIPQQTEEGAEPRYIAEIWWQIGNWHFDQIDPHGGPYNLNRSATAYLHFLEMGGNLAFEELTPDLLKRILNRNHPILAGLSATHLYGFMRDNNASHYQRLTGFGLEEDIRYCLTSDLANVLPFYEEGKLNIHKW